MKNEKEKMAAVAGRWAVAAALVALTVTAYSGVLGNGFVHYDDNTYVTDNYHVQQGLSWAGVKWAFSSLYEHNWHPLTWLSHMADVSMFGMEPAGHHLVNLVFHCLGALLLFGFLTYTTGRLWAPAFVAALFSLHPLHVQSVAWVAERKDVLSTCFLFAALWMYAVYVRRPSRGRYVGVIVLYILGLMCKPMLVTLPALLLVLDYWPLERFDVVGAGDSEVRKRPESRASFGALLVEKIPLAIIAAAACAVTMVAQEGAIAASSRVGVGMRVANAMVSYWRYIGEMVYPAGLAAFYPYPTAPMYWQAAGAGLGLAGVTALVFYYRHTQRYLLAGWLWYMITLVPVIGFVQVGAQSHADRYTYVPLVGLFISVAWAGGQFARRSPACKYAMWVLAAAIIPTLWVLTSKNVPYWKDDISLFGRAAQVSRDSDLMLANYGSSLIAAGDLDKAQRVLDEALKLGPRNANTLCNLGIVLCKKERYGEALPYLARAAAIQPDMKEANLNAGKALMKLGRYGEARGYLQKALDLDQRDVQAYLQLGVVMHRLGKSDEGIKLLQRAVALAPRAAAPYVALGMTLAEMGRKAEGIEQLKRAAELEPQNEMVLACLRQVEEKK